MTREEEIKRAAETYYGEMYHKSAMEYFAKGAKWADEHPKNPFRDAKTDRPEDDSDVIVLLEDKSWTKGFCRGKIWYVQRHQLQNNYYARSKDVTHWMPIPELPKGGEKC